MQSGLCIQKKLPKRLDEWENQSIQISPDIEHAFEKYLLRIEQSEYSISSSDDRPSSDHFYKNRS